MKLKKCYQKMAEKRKQIMSMLLILAMIMLSVPAPEVMAAGYSPELPVEISQEGLTGDEIPGDGISEDGISGDEISGDEIPGNEIPGNETADSVSSPAIVGKKVTFYYENSSASSVYLAGSMNEWSTSATPMTKDENGVFSCTLTLSPGRYTYKYVVDVVEGNWIADPLNPNHDSSGNSLLILPGLADASATGVKGTEIELPSVLDYVDNDGNSSSQAVTYAVKNAADADYVTIAANKVTVSASYTGDTMELTATAANSAVSDVTIYLYDKTYTYTIYVRSSEEARMSADASALWIWDAAEETAAVSAEYFFEPELVTLADGNTWLKAEVSLNYAQKLGIIFKSKGSWTWQSANLSYENTAQTDTELYYIDGETQVYTSLEEISADKVQRSVVIEYTRTDNDYTDTNVYTWTESANQTYNFKEQNGKYLAKIPVADPGSEQEIYFIVRKGTDWETAVKDGGDNSVTIPADQNVVKVRFANGSITKILPYNCGSEIDRANGKITFYYRDDSLFASNTLSSLEQKVQLVVKSSTGTASTDGTYTMNYDADAERFFYQMDLADDTDYYYYYQVDGSKVMDAYNSKTETLEGEEYNLLSNRKYNLELTASVLNAEMDYNDNNLLTVDWSGKDGENLNDFAVEKIYADLSQLGLDSQTIIEPKLKQLTIGCQDDIPAGAKTIEVTLVDNYGNTYTATAGVTVTERVKTENSDGKLGDFDWDEAVIYFAVTDRFFDGNTGNNNAEAGYDADDTTNQGRYHGGDFAGLTQKIDYLYELGVNTIWLTPIVDNIDDDMRAKETDGIEFYGYHGYWASDFTKLNPHLGTEEEFKALIDAAHAKGMKIMVDVVLNHAGYETTDYFNTILQDKDGNYINMIRGEQDTIEGDEQKASLSGLPDFLTESEEVRNQLIEWQTTWMKNYDIDYYRVDTVKHVDNTTWSAFRNALTAANPDFKLIGEYYDAGYTNDHEQLDSGRMDSLLDFDFKKYAKDFALGSLSAVEAELAKRDEAISNTAMLGSFLSSHDENGLLYTFMNDCGKEKYWAEAMMKVAATLQITAKGQPVIYYGEEIGLTGSSVYPYYDNRYDFDWTQIATQEADETSFYNHYKKMLNIRRDYSEVFAKGTRSVVAGADADGYEVIRRSYEGINVYAGMNVWGDDREAKFYVSGAAGSTYTDLYSNKTYTVADDGSLTVTIPKATEGGTAVLALTAGEDAEIKDTNTVTVKLHYYREDNDYTDWNAWIWLNGKGGAQYDFAEENGEMVATISVEGRATDAVYYRIRKGDWKENDISEDRKIDISDVVSGTVHYYVKSGVYAGTRVLGADAIIGSKILSASYSRDTNKVTIVTSRPVSGSTAAAFTIRCTDGTEIGISSVKEDGCNYTLTLEKNLSSMDEILKSYLVRYDGYDYSLVMPNIYSSTEFESEYTYKGNDLGAVWSKDSTTFKVWSPTADKVQIALYRSGTEGTEDLINNVDMVKGEAGVWSAVVNGDLNGTYYTYLVTANGETKEACDPYARTTGVNGKRAMVIDLDSTDPEGWDEDVSPNAGMEYTDAIIYELHIRDLSIDDSSGVSKEHQGKFLGLTETGTTTENGVPTALDHIVNLGVTHVHLLPVYDYASVDETQLDKPQFNWGYDPLNYNTPEGSYSTDPYNGEVRVSEMKQMVKSLHENNINVIMDVVYNHVYDADTFCFNQIVPKYFSRTYEDGSYSNGSGCGNDTASERAMVQKYIIDSVMYWAEEYHIDGFRFDLVGLLDTETMNAVINAVHEKYPNVIFYGEGWTLQTQVSKNGCSMATQANAAQTPELAYFSDTIRDLLAGNNGTGKGFVSGLTGQEEPISKCFTATTWWCPEPTQTINYASCHDNYTLMDKLNVTTPGAAEADRIRMNNLAAAIYMTSQGIPFIHAGEEFLRTKVDENGEVIHNSYNSSDYVNKLRWNNLEDKTYAAVSDYYAGLIEFRKNHKALRLTTKEEVAANVSYHWVTNEVVLFNIKGKTGVEGEISDGIVVIFNATNEEKTFSLYGDSIDYGIAEGEWKVCIDGEKAGIEVLDTITDGKVTVAPISAMVLVKGETADEDSVYDENIHQYVTLNKKTLKLEIGESETLIAKTNVAGAAIIWSTDNEAVATVNENGQVTAVGAGTTTIRATAGTKSAACTVEVNGKPDEDEIEIPTGITAVTNLHTKLSDVTLPEGWEWLYGDIPLKSFAGVQEKKFQAVYTKEGYEPVVKEIAIHIVTVSKINVTADASVVEKGKTAGLYAEIITTGGSVPEDMITVQWNSSKTDIATVTPDTTDKRAADVTGVKEGTTQVQASVKISDGKISNTLVSAKKSIKVTGKATAMITFREIENFTKKDSGNVYVHSFTGSTKAVVTIESTASKLKLKSSDSKTVSVGKVTKDTNGNFTAQLIIKKAGYVELGAVADDDAKTSAEVELYIKNAVPNVSAGKVELNNKTDRQASVFIYPNEDYTIEAVSIDSAEFAVSRINDTDEYAVSMVKTVAKGTYKQTLTIKINGVEEQQVPLTISVVSKEPSVKIKQTAKVNLFYTDSAANGSLNLMTSEAISKVELKDCDFEYDYAAKEISVKATADRANLDKKGILSITFEDYASPIEKNITIATENKAPKFALSAKSGTLYPTVGIETAQADVIDVTTGKAVNAEEMQVSFRKDVTAYSVTKTENTISFMRTDNTFTSKSAVDIAVQRSNFSQPVKLVYTINVSSKTPSLVLDKKAMTLNKNAAVGTYEADTVKAGIKAAPQGDIKELTIEAADAKSQKVMGTSIVFETAADGMIMAKLSDTASLGKGTYKFTAYARITDTCTVNTKFFVKVVDAAPEKTVALKKSGSIDVLNRDTTALVYTPKLTNITGEIKDVALAGRSAHLFKAELENGKIKVTVKGDSKQEQNTVNLVTKYNYGIKLRLTLENGAGTCEIVTNEVKFKLQQSKPRITVLPKQAVMFNMAGNNTLPITVSAQNKTGTEVGIKKIELTNFTNAFSLEDGKLTLVNRGKVVKGKTYSLKFKVYYEGCADSEKVTVVTYKVKVN